MNSREKILAAILTVALAVFLVIPAIWSMFRGPIQIEERRKNTVETKLKTASEEFDVAMAKLARLKDFKERSLPSNTTDALTAYQQWLSDLAEIVVKFPKPRVEAERLIPSKDNSYSLVRIKITSEGTMSQLRDFLYHFHRANILHHISSLTIDANDNSPNPRLSINLMAEAISLRSAPVKGFPSLFPRAVLEQDIKEKSNKSEASEIHVRSAQHFPKDTPFRVRIADKFATVTKVVGDTWTITPDANEVLTASKDTTIELATIHPDFATKKLTDYDVLIDKNPFAKPVPYRPQLELVGTKSVDRGKTLSLTPTATGFSTKKGAPTYQIVGDTPAGMQLVGNTLTWTPTKDQKAGVVKVTVKALSPELKAPLESTFELTLKDINTAPKLETPKDLVATIGQPISVKLSATDAETPANQLKFKLNDPKPEGIVLDESSGELRWTPAASVAPGAVSVSVAVTDNGSPPQSSTISMTITVQDDTAQFTFLTASVAADTERQAWLYDRSKNVRLILKEGRPLKYAGFDALVTKIGKDFVRFQQKDTTWRMTLGQNLREAVIDRSAPPLAPPMPEERS